MKVVIVGAVAGGATFATSLRRLDDASTCIRCRVGMLEFEFHYSFFSSSIVQFIGVSTNSLVSAISHTS